MSRAETAQTETPATCIASIAMSSTISWEGMSGAPVFAFSKDIGVTKIIGTNAGHIRGQGPAGGVISHFVRSSALIDLMVQLGEPRPQPVTTVAHEEEQRRQKGKPGWFAEPPSPSS